MKGAFVGALGLGVGMALLLFVACGGGTGAGTGTGGDGSTVIPPGACSSLTCLDSVGSLLASCRASGSCEAQFEWPDSGPTMTMIVRECHSNGIKAFRTGDQPAADGSIHVEMTVKNGDSVCYSLSGSVSGSSAAVGSFTYKDASGAIILTETVEESGNATVTCPGGTPTLIDSACDAPVSGLAGLAPGMDGTCTQGTCSF